MTNGAQASILGICHFFYEWFFDLAILWGSVMIAPLFGYWVYRSVEYVSRCYEGVDPF